MSPVTHFLAGWMIANSAHLDRRQRALVATAAIIPDIDGLGVIADVLTRSSAHPTNLFGQYHHSLHNLAFAVAVTVLAAVLAAGDARRRLQTAAFVFLSFHLHLLGDLLGARGPDGDQWPMSYLAPFSDAWQLTWSGQWALNAWPNFVITITLLLVTFWLAVQRGYSPLEIVSSRADAAFVSTVRTRFTRNKAASGGIR